MELRLYNFHRLISGFISSTLLDEPVGIPTPAPKSDSRAGRLETFLTPRPDGHFGRLACKDCYPRQHRSSCTQNRDFLRTPPMWMLFMSDCSPVSISDLDAKLVMSGLWGSEVVMYEPRL